MATPSTSNIPHRHLRHLRRLSALMASVGLLDAGYRSVSRITLRLNLPAANALFGQLGIAAIAPQ